MTGLETYCSEVPQGRSIRIRDDLTEARQIGRFADGVRGQSAIPLEAMVIHNAIMKKLRQDEFNPLGL